MYCGQCGTPNSVDADTCVHCGVPLLVTAGARTCANCGAAVGDHDRFCMTCGTQIANNGVESAYNPADDFGELDIDDIQLEELPDWLQSMAPGSMTGETEPDPARSARPDQPTPEDLPDWLRETPEDDIYSPSTPPPPSDPVGVDHQPADQFSLVSDDDLPDWLKALSDEGDDAASSTPSQAPAYSASASRSTAVANLFEVPPISRAWLTQGRTVDEADVSIARQEFSPLEVVSSLQSADQGAESIWDAETKPFAAPTPAEEETRSFSAVDSETGTSLFAGRGKLIARIVILVLLVIVILLLAFVLIQGL